MIELRVFRTKSDEGDLLFRLIGRDRRADLYEHHFSVDTYDLKNGWVVFTLLQCTPASSFKVGVSGNLVIVNTKNNNDKEVESWLKNWKIKYKNKRVLIRADTPEQARTLIEDIRKKAMSEEARKTMLTKLYEKIKRERE